MRRAVAWKALGGQPDAHAGGVREGIARARKEMAVRDLDPENNRPRKR